MVLHACPHCTYTTAHATNFKIHIRLHIGARPRACNQCNATFSQPFAFKFHMALHLDVLPFVCGLCGYGFAQKVNCQSTKLGAVGNVSRSVRSVS